MPPIIIIIIIIINLGEFSYEGKSSSGAWMTLSKAVHEERKKDGEHNRNITALSGNNALHI